MAKWDAIRGRICQKDGSPFAKCPTQALGTWVRHKKPELAVAAWWGRLVQLDAPGLSFSHCRRNRFGAAGPCRSESSFDHRHSQG